MKKYAIKAFFEVVNKNPELKEQFGKLRAKYKKIKLSEKESIKFLSEDLIPFANSLGFEFNINDYLKLKKAEENRPLSDEELGLVSGGANIFSTRTLGLSAATLMMSSMLFPACALAVGGDGNGNGNGTTTTTTTVQTSSTGETTQQQQQTQTATQSGEGEDRRTPEFPAHTGGGVSPITRQHAVRNPADVAAEPPPQPDTGVVVRIGTTPQFPLDETLHNLENGEYASSYTSEVFGHTVRGPRRRPVLSSGRRYARQEELRRQERLAERPDVPNVLVDDELYHTDMKEPMFLRQNMSIEGVDPGIDENGKVLPPITEMNFGWLTCSTGHIVFKNLRIKGKIQVTAHANVTFENCIIEQYEEKNECSVEVYSGSIGTFRNCIFSKSNKAAVVVRDRSQALFDNCKFTDCKNTAILSLDNSVISAKNSKFEKCGKFAIYCHQGSKGSVTNCNFSDMPGTSIFLLKESEGIVEDCFFGSDEEGEGTCTGGISAADSSKINIKRCNFKKTQTGVRAVKNSEANVYDSVFNDVKRNGTCFEFSKGTVRNCSFSEIAAPAIATFGYNCNPVIQDCKIDNMSTSAIVARDCSAPTFYRLEISNCDKRPVCAFSDFARPVISDCLINCEAAPIIFSVCNGADAYITRNNIINRSGQDVFEIFTKAKVSFGSEGNRFAAQLDKDIDLLDSHSNFTEEAEEIQTDSGDTIVVPVPQPILEIENLNEYVSRAMSSEPSELEKRLLAAGELAPHSSEVEQGATAYVYSPCGHRVDRENLETVLETLEHNKRVRESGEGSEIGLGDCPICHVPVQKAVQVFESELSFGEDENQCLVCMDHKADTLSLHCGHKHACYKDATKLWLEKRECCTCKARMDVFRYDFGTVKPAEKVCVHTV